MKFKVENKVFKESVLFTEVFGAFEEGRGIIPLY